MNISDIPTQLLLLLVFGVITLVAVLTVVGMRYDYRKSGKEEVYKNGIVVTESGIEYLSLFAHTRTKTFDEIDSVELSPYFKVAISTLLFRYGLNMSRVPPNFFGHILVVELKNPRKYLFFSAPKNATEICERLQSRIGHQTRAANKSPKPV
jgi:hypothetical protein